MKARRNIRFIGGLGIQTIERPLKKFALRIPERVWKRYYDLSERNQTSINIEMNKKLER